MVSEIKKKILIAEDDRAISSALKMKLESEGFEVTQAFDGKEAVETLGKAQFDMMLLDLIMPVLDGFGVLQEIKTKGIKIKSLILSNLGQEEDIIKTKELGAIDYIVKADLDLQQIVARIKSHMT